MTGERPEAPLSNQTAKSARVRDDLWTKGPERLQGWSRSSVFLLASLLRRVLFQWGPLPPARLNLSCIVGRVSGKRTRPQRSKSLEAQRLEILLMTPSLQTARWHNFVYNLYGTGDRSRQISLADGGHPEIFSRGAALDDCPSSSACVIPNKDERDNGNCNDAGGQGNWIGENIFCVP